MKLSIIIPTFNEEKYLPGLLETIHRQSFRDYEIIVADHNSVDNTRVIANKFGAKVIDGGLPAKSRNNGASIAQGEILLFLDADVLLPHKDYLLNTILEFEQKNLAVAASLPIPLSKKQIDLLFHHVYNAWVKISKRYMPHAAGFCIFVKRVIHEQIKGFDEEIYLAEDHDYAKRAGQIGAFDFLKEKLLVSVRRMDRDGRLNVAAKYLACEVYLLFGGRVKKDFFKYRWGYDKQP